MKKRIIWVTMLVLLVFVGTWLFNAIDKKKNTPLPKELNPTVAENKDLLITKAKEKGITILVYDDIRTTEEQNTLYEQGRTTSGNIVTYSKGGESYHNYGLAIDFALQLKDGNVIWDLEYDGNRNGQSDWMEVVSIAKELGFQWGGDWDEFKDYPHLQMDFGLSIHELQWGERPKFAMD